MASPTYWTRVRGRYMRGSARFFFRRPLAIRTDIPLISFTFDDFPRSALQTGGAMLKHYALGGTYYASLGLMGRRAPTGTMFIPEDLNALLEQGHELGCHTFGHCHAWDTKPDAFENSIIENQQALRKLCPGVSFRTFSYPIGVPRARTKQRAARHFSCCRGGGQTFNAGTADLNYLAAYFLEKSRDDPQTVTNLIDQNRRARGWLIFATHDISGDPTPWGCSPHFFENILQYAVGSGARILPVAQALEVLRTPSFVVSSS